MFQFTSTVYRQSSLVRIVTGTLTSTLVVGVMSGFSPKDMLLAAAGGAILEVAIWELW